MFTLFFDRDADFLCMNNEHVVNLLLTTYMTNV